MIKEIFLDKLSNSGEFMDKFISKFMDIKNNIGNGVGAGKLFESLFVGFINRHNKPSQVMSGLYAIHLNLSNSSFIWDIIISDDSESLSKKELIISAIRSNDNIENKITKILGKNWIGCSLKTYKEDACQITTDYSYRTYLEENLKEGTWEGDSIDHFFGLLNKHDKERYIILALNTYDKKSTIENKISKLESGSITESAKVKINRLKEQFSLVKNEYSFRLLSFDKKFDKITFKKNPKLSQYDLSIGGVNYFKVLYGKNQANPFQRGIWTHNGNSIEYFKLIKSGSYKVDNYFQEMIISTIFE